MLISPGCIPCIVKQSYTFSRLLGVEEKSGQRKIIYDTMGLLLENKEIVFAVRSNEILNDITLKDAKKLGIDKLCKVIESGSRIAGTDLNECTTEFLDLYKNSDIVIAKGQGNFETLLNSNRSIYFLFKIKCEVISEICGYPVGTGLLYFKKYKRKK